jgi:hypothetical protein
MQTILRILTQAGGWHHGLYLKIENHRRRRACPLDEARPPLHCRADAPFA